MSDRGYSLPIVSDCLGRRVPNPELRVPSPESRVPNPESRIPAYGAGDVGRRGEEARIHGRPGRMNRVVVGPRHPAGLPALVAQEIRGQALRHTVRAQIESTPRSTNAESPPPQRTDLVPRAPWPSSHQGRSSCPSCSRCSTIACARCPSRTRSSGAAASTRASA